MSGSALMPRVRGRGRRLPLVLVAVHRFRALPAARVPGEGRWALAGRTEGPGPAAGRRWRDRCRCRDAAREECDEMSVSYYDALPPVREPGRPARRGGRYRASLPGARVDQRACGPDRPRVRF